MPQLMIATLNPGKRREMRALLKGLGLELLDPPSLRSDLSIEEVTDNYATNARLKALTYSRATGLWTVADDSGLEVDVLDGAPGPASARLAGPGRSDGERRHRLLELLQPHPRPWTARFRCTVALASPEGRIDLAEGTCEGEILPEERGSGGFGYDPIFYVKGIGRTMSELSMAEKNQISHRAQAVRALLPILRQRLGLNRGTERSPVND